MIAERCTRMRSAAKWRARLHGSPPLCHDPGITPSVRSATPVAAARAAAPTRSATPRAAAVCPCKGPGDTVPPGGGDSGTWGPCTGRKTPLAHGVGVSGTRGPLPRTCSNATTARCPDAVSITGSACPAPATFCLRGTSGAATATASSAETLGCASPSPAGRCPFFVAGATGSVGA